MVKQASNITERLAVFGSDSDRDRSSIGIGLFCKQFNGFEYCAGDGY